MAYLLLLVLPLVLGACSKPPTVHSPETVNTEEAKTILLTDSADGAEACAGAVRDVGGRVLYQNDVGLILTDLAPGDAALARCEATITPNFTSPPAPAVRAESRATDESTDESQDLSTLLRLLPAEEMRARSFVRQHPAFDGRGIVIAVLDTGLELDHPVLSKTTTGEAKISDVQDFSGEGRVDLQAVTAEGGTVSATHGTYKVEGIAGSDLHLGLFPASTIARADRIATKDTFVDLGVLSFKTEAGLRARIDTDADKDFTDESDLHDFSASRAFVRIGAARSLAVALNIQLDGKRLVLFFDDGSHGTHVAGIAAGYDPRGLQGVAPGAKVMGLKIGDNRLAGGSTTTASKMLAIDYAAQKGAHIVNLSYGIRAGSDLGRSAIDQYVDRVARQRGVLFAISGGNEGPGIQTIGTPAGADLAITAGAFVSKETARENYGFVNVYGDHMWYFSSVGPRTDGGWKPSIAAPGSALSSVPLWMGGHENFRGTSMAAPQVAGALALVLSAAKGLAYPTDRPTVTRAFLNGAKRLDGITFVEQGRGLADVPATVERLGKLKGEPGVEYSIGVNSPVSPEGVGRGIFVRSGSRPANAFTVAVTPEFPQTMSAGEQQVFLRTFRLEASADWIRTPGTFWIHGGRRAFQVDLDWEKLSRPGLYSERIQAIDEKTGEVAFDLPVTVVRPEKLDESNGHELRLDLTVRVGETKRLFLQIPAGATAVEGEIVSNGPRVWGQLLDSRGKFVAGFNDGDATAPLARQSFQAGLDSAGVYEIDLVGPEANERPAKVSLRIRALSLSVTRLPFVTQHIAEVAVQNNFGGIKILPNVELRAVERRNRITIQGDKGKLPIEWSAADADLFAGLDLVVETAERFYDLMTDFPYNYFCADGSVLEAGGLEEKGTVHVAQPCPGTFELQGAFTEEAPASWYVDVTERRPLRQPVLVHQGAKRLVETGQRLVIPLDFARAVSPAEGFEACLALRLTNEEGKLLQETTHCR